MIQSSEVWATAEYSGGIVAAGLPGAAVGALAANILAPSTVHLGEGLAVQASLGMGEKGVEVAYGPTVLHMPNLATHIPFIKAGVNIGISQFNIPLNSHGFSEIAGLASQFNTAIEDPIKHAIIEKLAIGGGLGAALGAGLGAMAIHKLRRKSFLTRVNEFPANFKDRLVNKRRHTLQRLGLCGLALAGCTQQGTVIMSDQIPLGPHPTLVSEIYPNNIEALDNATISGTGADLAKGAAKVITAYTGAVNTFWQQGANRAATVINTYENGSGEKYTMGKNIISVMNVSDIHCNLAAYKYYFPTVIAGLNPDIIVNSGDTFSNSDTMPYEKGCSSGFTSSIAKANKATLHSTVEVEVAGNHDPLELDPTLSPKVIPLDSRNNYTATVDSMTFVGAPDPIRTTWSNRPSSPLAQEKLLAQAGSQLAARACSVMQESPTHEPPVINVHDAGQGYEAAMDGCTSLVETGHTHREKSIQRFITSNGATGLWHKAGTATGANIGLSIYQTPQYPATLMMQYFNKMTRRFVGFATLTLTAGGIPHITEQKVPDINHAKYDSHNAQYFLHLYSSTYNRSSN